MYRLLIIDDPQGCENAKTLLNWADYGFTAVMTAHSYIEGVNLALDLHPHLILLGTGSAMRAKGALSSEHIKEF